MWALFILQIKSFFKSAGSIFTFVLPLALLIILGYTIPASWIIPSVVSIGILSTALFQFGTSLEEVKRTAFMKSVGLTRLNKLTTFLTFLIFTLIVTLIGIGWILFWSWFLTTPVPFLSEDWGALAAGIPPLLTQLHWEDVMWGSLIYSWAINITLSFAMAFLFLSITKTSESYNFLSIGYVFAVLFLGGVLLPDFLVKLSGENWIQYGYYVVPHYYINTFSIATFGGGIGDKIEPLVRFLDQVINGLPESVGNNILDGIENTLGINVDSILNYPGFQAPWDLSTSLGVAKVFAPLGFIVLFVGIGTYTFRWG